MKKTLITAPTEQPVTTAELKEWSVVEHTEDDAIVAALIDSATKIAEEYTGRYFVDQVWQFAFDEWPSGELTIVGARNVIAVDRIQYKQTSGTFLAQTGSAITDNYFIDDQSTDLKICAVNGWPSTYSQGYNNVLIDVNMGYGAASTVPEPLKVAIKLLCAHLYKNRESSVIGTISGELPQGLNYHLDPYRVRGL